jgi:2-keto-4-pentenoate hydratase/2-oxohepta-3-ene-1,7-dioic acid hydratase in catechol pathway
MLGALGSLLLAQSSKSMKIICIGRNYVAHAHEFNEAVPEEPIFFMKPDTALLRNNDPFYIPDWSNDVHHEIELVIKINRIGKNIEKRFANRYYDEIGLGIDFTARDVQAELKKKGLPWEKAKAFDKSAVLSANFFSKRIFPDDEAIKFYLNINGETVQESHSGMMIFDFDELIAHISKYVTLKIGDLIYTGTPANVGPVKIGDRLEGYLEDKKMFDFQVK